MADQNITELPVKTSSGMTSSDYMLGIDSAEGYQMLIKDLGDYIIRNVQVNTIAGANQTLKSALDTLNSKVAVPSKLLTKNNATVATIHLPSNGRFVIFETCNGANSLCAMLVTVYSNGAAYKLDLAKSSEVSAELSTNTLTITSTPNVSFRILIMSLESAVSIDEVTIS